MDSCSVDWGALGQWLEVAVVVIAAWQAYKWYYVQVYWVPGYPKTVPGPSLGSTLSVNLPGSIRNHGNFLIQDIYIRLDSDRWGETLPQHQHIYKVSASNFCPGNYGIWLNHCNSMVATDKAALEETRSHYGRVHLYFLSNGIRWHRNPEGKLSPMFFGEWEGVLAQYPAWTGSWDFPRPLTWTSPQPLDKFDEHAPKAC